MLDIMIHGPYLIQHDDIALEAAAGADEVSEAQQQRQRNPPPLAAAQLPGSTEEVSSHRCL